jgi:hypothetical protein
LVLGREVVRVRRRKFVLAAKERGDLVERGLDFALRADESVDVNGIDSTQENPSDDRKRHEDAIVEILVCEFPPAVLNTHDFELTIAHTYCLPDGVLAREEVRCRD